MALPGYFTLCVKFIHKVSDRSQLSRINMPEWCLQRITTTMQILNFNYWFVKLKGQYYIGWQQQQQLALIHRRNKANLTREHRKCVKFLKMRDTDVERVWGGERETHYGSSFRNKGWLMSRASVASNGAQLIEISEILWGDLPPVKRVSGFRFHQRRRNG